MKKINDFKQVITAQEKRIRRLEWAVGFLIVAPVVSWLWILFY